MRVLKITNRSKKPERTGSGVDLLARRRGLPEEVLEETRAEFLAQRATRLGSACRSLTRKGPAEHARVRTRTLSPEGSADSKPVPRIGREEGAGPHGRANQDPDSALEKGNEQWRSIAQLSILLPWQHTAPSSWPCHHTATEGTPVWTGCEGHRAGGAPCRRPVLLLPPGSCSPAYAAARRERACGRRAAPAARGPVRTATRLHRDATRCGCMFVTASCSPAASRRSASRVPGSGQAGSSAPVRSADARVEPERP